MANGYRAFALALVVLYLLLRIIAVRSDNKTALSLPPGWQQFCSMEDQFVHWNFTTLSAREVHSMIQISCHVTDEREFYFTDIRKWSAALDPVRGIALRVDCSENASIYAPWPMKAKNLVYFHVARCRIKHFYEEHFADIITILPDEIRVMTIEDCVVTMTFKVLARLLNYTSLVKPEADCGPLTAESMVLRGIQADLDESDFLSDFPPDLNNPTTNTNGAQPNSTMEPHIPIGLLRDLTPGNDSSSNESADDLLSKMVVIDSTKTDPLVDLDCIEFFSEFISFFITTNPSAVFNKSIKCIDFAFEKLEDAASNTLHKCNFDSLRYLDESHTGHLGSKHVRLMNRNGRFKELRVYNLSRVNYNELPVELLTWQDYTRFRKLEFLDFSYNNLSVIPDFKYGGDYSQNGTIDLRYNNITVFSRLMLDRMLDELRFVFIRLEGNPLNCSCEAVQEFYTFLKEKKSLANMTI